MKIGLTTTVPIEPLYASENIPYDLNNIFITSTNPLKHIEFAEASGYPRNVCNWIKGLYSVTLQERIDMIVGVVRGDCSNTDSLLETLEHKNVKTYFFSYPYPKKYSLLKSQIENFMDFLKVSDKQIRTILPKIESARSNAWKIDEITYTTNKIHGEENHIFLVSTSDFFSDLNLYVQKTSEFLEKIKEREEIDHNLRIGYIGVPPIFLNLYNFLEQNKALVVFNEVQRQFSMPYPDTDWRHRYLKYTYPYSVFDRIEDIKKQIKLRKLDGLIHYVQSFCHRQITDVVLKETLDIPILTIEGNQPESLDERTKIRIESFLDMLL